MPPVPRNRAVHKNSSPARIFRYRRKCSFAIASASAEKEIDEAVGKVLSPGCGTRVIGLLPHPGKMLSAGSRFTESLDGSSDGCRGLSFVNALPFSRRAISSHCNYPLLDAEQSARRAAI